MAIRCNNCYTKVNYLGEDLIHGGTRIQCPDCGKLWSMGQSMTGPEKHFYPIDENGDIRSYSDAPIDTLNPNCLFYLALIIIIAVFFLIK